VALEGTCPSSTNASFSIRENTQLESDLAGLSSTNEYLAGPGSTNASTSTKEKTPNLRATWLAQARRMRGPGWPRFEMRV
jgi:hypothetical protein